MGKLDSFAITGLDCWFNSHDHLPHHFHARKPGEWEIRVFFLLCSETKLNYEVKWGDEPSKRYRREILDAVLSARVALLEEWEAKVCR